MTKSKNPELLNNLEKAARTGGISKREFLQYSMLAGVTASTATRSLDIPGKSAAQAWWNIPLWRP